MSSLASGYFIRVIGFFIHAVHLKKATITHLCCLIIAFDQHFCGLSALAIPAYEIKGTSAQIRLQNLSERIRSKPKDPEAYVARAEFWLNYAMMGRAKNDLEQSIAIAPNASAYVWLAKINVEPDKNGENKIARGYLEKARAVGSRDLQGLLKTANAYTEIKAYKSAVECFESALKLQPGDLNIICWRALAYMNAGRFKDAIAGASYVLSKSGPIKILDPKKKLKDTSPEFTAFALHLQSLRARGVSLASLHRDAEALPDLTTALELAPGDHQLLKSRAEVYRRLGKKNLADKDLRLLEENREFIYENALFSSDNDRVR